MTTVNLKIAGMSCAACAARIEKGLGRLTGVEKATVNFATEQASVTFDPAQLSLSDLAKKIESLGFSIVTDKVELKISGMSCAACAARVEKALRGMPNVYQASVNFAAEKASVEYNAHEVTVNQIQERVAKIGFEAHNIADASQVDREKQVREDEIRGQRFAAAVYLYDHQQSTACRSATNSNL
ncbi:heavy-metal-associated domain-containing protein [bacterium BFN5]|nr:heavy-metal-associated domain-containing protein [bacterium BFN5]